MNVYELQEHDYYTREDTPFAAEFYLPMHTSPCIRVVRGTRVIGSDARMAPELVISPVVLSHHQDTKGFRMAYEQALKVLEAFQAEFKQATDGVNTTKPLS